MAWLLDFLTRDPYTYGREAGIKSFTIHGLFPATTRGGCNIKYLISCVCTKIDAEAFKRWRMLDEESKHLFLIQVNEAIVKKILTENGREFILINERGTQPILCYAGEQDGKPVLFRDIGCNYLNAVLNKQHFSDCGCRIAYLTLEIPRISDELIELNYNNIKNMSNVKSFEASSAYSEMEEGLVIAAAKKDLEIRRRFQKELTTQTHKGERLTIETESIGDAVKLTWTLTEPLTSNFILRGFRKQDGFAVEPSDSGGNGECIAEDRRSNSMVQGLREDVNYYFTFLILMKGENGIYSRIVESLRFSIRIPAKVEIEYLTLISSWLHKKPAPPPPMSKPDPKREKIDRALHELISFVEFDESLTELEKNLVNQINSKGYAPEEQEEKIGRLRGVVESLRAENM